MFGIQGAVCSLMLMHLFTYQTTSHLYPMHLPSLYPPLFLSQKVLSLPTTSPEILFICKAYFNHFVLWESSFVSPAWVWSLPFPFQLFSSSSILKLWDWVSISCFVVMLYRLNFHVSQIGRSAQNFFPLFSYSYLQPFCHLLSLI